MASVKYVDNLAMMDQYFRFHAEEGQILKRVPPFLFLHLNGLSSVFYYNCGSVRPKEKKDEKG